MEGKQFYILALYSLCSINYEFGVSIFISIKSDRSLKRTSLTVSDASLDSLNTFPKSKVKAKMLKLTIE